MSTQIPSPGANISVIGGDAKSTLKVWGERFPVDNRAKVMAALLLLTVIGYYISWVVCATLLCLVVIPLLEMMNMNRRARNAVQGADRVIGGALATGRRPVKRTAPATGAQTTAQAITPSPAPATKAI